MFKKSATVVLCFIFLTRQLIGHDISISCLNRKYFQEINNFALESAYFVSLCFITFSFDRVFLGHSKMESGWSSDIPQYYLDKGYTYEYLSNGYFLLEIGKFEIFV